MSDNSNDKLIGLISPLVATLGYEIVYLEINVRQKQLRLFIDHLERSDAIGIEDCVKVTKALDEPLDQMAEVTAIFGEAGYELEVSSPGIDRPLRTARDFEKFKGKEVRVHTFRPLTAEEASNPTYQAKNPKQKNFLGTLEGLQDGKVRIAINLTGGRDKTQSKTQKKKKTVSVTNSAEVVAIPLPLISKANLEPTFDSALEEA